jgi:anaerobic magnesium-protoporphyrin IX monomethyl ester cyclase
MTSVALAFPTGTDPRSPYLALPSLAATLRHAGLGVSIHDLDIGGIHFLLSRSRLEEAGSRFRQAFAKSDSLFDRRLAARSEELPELGPRYLATLRDPVAFYDSNEFASARAGLLDALDLCSTARDERLAYSIDPIRYDIEGVDNQSLSALMEVTRDDRFNLFSEYWQTDLYPALARQAPVFVGITITNRQQMLPGLLLARRLRERGYCVVIGGALITKFAAGLRRLPVFFETFADAVIAYEGETACMALADALEHGKDISEAPNLLFMRGGEVRMTTTHVEDVAGLPTPDFSGLPLDKYLSPVPVFPVLIGKGCYFNRCKFCDIPYINHISKKAYRIRSTETIVNDLIELNRRFGCRHFEFTDEALPPRTLEHLAEELSSRSFHEFRFVGYARLEPGFTRTLCRKLADVGFRKFFFGLESGCQATLDHMDKDIRVSEVPAVLRNCRDAGILFHVFSILGFPEETPARASETVRFFEDHHELINTPGNSFDVHPFGLEMRTEYAEKAGNFGVLIRPEALSKDFIVGVGDDWTNTRGMSPAEVSAAVASADRKLRNLYSDFHRGPQSLWPAFEEYSILYSDFYARHRFPFRSSLPNDDALDRYAVQWHPGAVLEESGTDEIRAVSRFGATLLSPQFANGLEEISGRALDQPITANLRAALDQLMAEGIIQLVPINPVITGGESYEHCD